MAGMGPGTGGVLAAPRHLTPWNISAPARLSGRTGENGLRQCPDSYIIEVGSQTAGIVVRNPDGYRFFAATHRFNAWKASYSATHARPSARRGVWSTAT